MALIKKIRDLHEKADCLGFAIVAPKFSYPDQDLISLKPKDSESLPIYDRDSQLFVGSIEELEFFLQGIEWARYYDKLLKVSDEKKRSRREQDYRNSRLLKILKKSN